MTDEIKTCQNCKNQFTIEPEDFKFYDKIKVPPPTFCPECRMIRRLLGRNARALSKRKCDAPGHTEDIISKYSSDKPFTVYDYKYWWSDGWNPMDYGFAYDWSRTFFAQLKVLLEQVPVRNLDITNSINCDYCPSAVDSKDCYLVAGGLMSQDCLYSDTPALSKQVVDSWVTVLSDTTYECFACIKSFNLMFSFHSAECMDSSFLYDCRNCSYCFGCMGLRNKQYHIFNKPYSKKEYFAELSKFDLGSYKKLQEIVALFKNFLDRFPRKFAEIKKSVDCTGDIIENARACRHCFEIRDGAENCKYMLLGGRGVKDAYDVSAGGVKSELIYEVAGIVGSQRVLFSDRVHQSANVYYSKDCYSSSNLFGCVGLRSKQYCILNKQYTKESFDELRTKIIQHMGDMPYVLEIRNSKSPTGVASLRTEIRKIVYKYGEYFPQDLAPFTYNESAAQEYFPISPEKAVEMGYPWKKLESSIHEVTKSPAELPDHTNQVSDEILKEVIGCAHDGKCGHLCTAAFKIIPRELSFYRKMNLPLPRLCPNCRHFERTKLRNPWRLWIRQCMCQGKQGANSKEQIVCQNQTAHFHGTNHCPNEFETSYAPERPEIVYCETCYQSEVA